MPKRMTRPLLRLASVSVFYTLLSLTQMHQKNLFFLVIISLIMGLILAGGLNLAHECLHLTFMKNRNFCRWVGRCSAGLILINFTVYKEHHLEHHRFVGTPKDTENNSNFKSLSQYLYKMTGFSLAKNKIVNSFAILAKKYPYYLNSVKKIHEARMDALYLLFFLFVVICLTFLYPSAMFFCYWLPLIFSFSFIMFFGLPEHYGCDVVSNVYSKARTIKTNGLIRFFLWNANFHAEHHLYPSISGDSLIKISELTKDHIVYREKSYVWWHLSLIQTLLKNKPVR